MATLDRGLATSAVRVASVAAISRVVGFLRVVVVAGVFGATFLANVYQSTNSVPNILFEFVAAGTLASIFVPTFVEHLNKGSRNEAWNAGNALTSLVIVGLTAVSLATVLLAPLLMRFLTLGIEDGRLRTDEIRIGTLLIRLFAPQILIYGLIAIFSAALQASGRFVVPAAASIVNNVVVIGVCLVYVLLRGDRGPNIHSVTRSEVLLLGIGTTAGVCSWAFIMLVPLRRTGWRFKWVLDLSHPAVRRVRSSGIWAFGYVESYYAGLIVILLLANQIEGGAAAYQWAFTIFVLPNSLLGLGIFSVLYPSMSAAAAQADVERFRDLMGNGLRMLIFVLVPIATVMFAVARPISLLILQQGAMTEEGATLVGRTLAGLAIGLPAYSATFMMTQTLFAWRSGRTATVGNLFGLATVSSLGSVFFAFAPEGWEVASLAFAHSVGYLLALALMGVLVSKRVGSFIDAKLVRTVLAAVGAGTASLLMMGLLRKGLFPVETRREALVAAPLTALAGIGTYLLVAWRLQVPELRRLGAALQEVTKRGSS